MKRHEPYVDDVAFVQAWQQGKTVKQIASDLGMNYFNVTSRASRLRKAGVKLKRLFPITGPRKVLDVPALNRVAKAALKE